MDHAGVFTRQEILSQPEAWQDALAELASKYQEIARFGEDKFDQVIFTGCGSTYYLSLAAAALLQDLSGRPARGLPASELWLSPGASYPREGRVLLVAVSRSGATSETLRACQAFKASGHGELVTLSCYADQPLAGIGDMNIVLPSGAERSVAQTRAFSTLYLATVALAAIWSRREQVFDQLQRLPLVARQLLERHGSLARALGQDESLERYYFLGSGLRYGLACELSLKMKEMSLSHSEPFHFMEFRHGPKSMVNEKTLLVGLLSEANFAHENQVLAEMESIGARILSMGESDVDVAFHSGLAETTRNILYLPIGQLLAFERALTKELNPDQPHNLEAVVRLQV